MSTKVIDGWYPSNASLLITRLSNILSIKLGDTLYFTLDKPDRSGVDLKEDWGSVVLSLIVRLSNSSSTNSEDTLYWVLGNSEDSGADLLCLLF